MLNEMNFLQNLNYVRTGGSKQELKAANYIKSELNKMGLKARLEDFDVQAAKIEKVSLEVVKPYKAKIKCAGFMCAKNTKSLEKELYYYRGKDNTTCHDVKNKIVLFDHGLAYWEYKDIFEKGAAGFIVCNGNLINDNQDIDLRELRGPHREVGELPGVAINISSAFEMIQKGAQVVRIKNIQKPYKNNSRNVVLDIKGKKKETIVFTAHYDSTALSKGMYDNATGSLGLMKIAEYYSNHTPNYNLTFVWCGSEERGLLGSKAYVKKHKKELKNYRLCINLDMIGTALGGFLACVTGEDKLVNYIEYFSKEESFSIHSYAGVYSSDSTPFADNGVPAVSFARITNYSPIHCRYDEIGMLNKDIIKQDINFILNFTKRIDNSKVMPVNKVIPEKIKEELDYYLLRKRKVEK